MTLTKTLIDEICEILNCSQQAVASLLDLTPHTLSHNRDKKLEELTPRTGERLSALFMIVNEHRFLRSEVIHKILKMHVFEDIKGNMDSVLSALKQDKYEIETLANIARIALNKYEQESSENEQSIVEDVKKVLSA